MDDDDNLEKTQIIRPGSAEAPKYSSLGDKDSAEKTVMIKPGQQPRARAEPAGAARAHAPPGAQRAAGAQTTRRPQSSVASERSAKGSERGSGILLIVSLLIGLAIAAGAAMLLL
jgi:hypothetical protein